jgi:hypothetical protein
VGDERSVQELIDEQRTRLRSSNPAERLAAALLIPALLTKRMRQLNDGQIGQLLEDEVWPNLTLLAPESTICLVAADRLRRHANRQPTFNEFEGGI